MELLAHIAEVRAALAPRRDARQRIGFVPTMGALHAGHAELIRVARAECPCVVVSIFVNPTQFGPHEDFAKYPRQLTADAELCATYGADVILAPQVSEMYPPGSTTIVEVAGLQDGLCGAARPGHFRGVATVVLKLFNIVQPDLAFFGAKDGQQVRIIEQMVRDLDVPVQIRRVPTVRAADGLALSSRNAYLSASDRTLAPRIYAALQATQAAVRAGERDVARLQSALAAALQAIPGARLDYAQIVDDVSLQPLTQLERPALAAVAVHLGTTRLIDNVELNP
jgi:pantoate--beta-alanine ligase